MGLVIPEKRISYISGSAIPKLANDQNTDDIMPARFLKEITFKNMGKYVYHNERFKDGLPILGHPFDKYSGANILLAGANYGCGSSREHAPQGLLRYGIKAIVAESFAEIFAGNCAMTGLVPVTAPRTHIESLAKRVESENIEIELDLDKKILYWRSREQGDEQIVSVDLPEGRRQAFLSGTWDSMAVLQSNPDEVEKVRKSLPYILDK